MKDVVRGVVNWSFFCIVIHGLFPSSSRCTTAPYMVRYVASNLLSMEQCIWVGLLFETL